MWRDVAINVVLYVPVGVFASLTLRSRAPWLRTAAPILLGFCFSFAVETAQVYDASRFPSFLDVLTNTSGTVIGVVVGLVATSPLVRQVDWLREHMDRSRSTSALILIWLADRLFPVFPRIGRYVFRQKWANFLSNAGSLTAFERTFVLYLALGVMLPRLTRHFATPLLIASVLLVGFEFLLAGRQPSMAEFAGAASGVLLALILGNRPSLRTIAAVCCIGFILISGLAPYHLQSMRNWFSWFPLEASFSSDYVDSLRTLVGKSALYGSSIWLLHAAGLRMLYAGTSTALLLAAIEFTQIWLPGRTPEITDPLLALALAAAFTMLDRSKGSGRLSEEAVRSGGVVSPPHLPAARTSGNTSLLKRR